MNACVVSRGGINSARISAPARWRVTNKSRLLATRSNGAALSLRCIARRRLGTAAYRFWASTRLRQPLRMLARQISAGDGAC
jgi:hypothetical protein